MQIKKLGLAAIVIGACALAGNATAQPDIGGTPVYTEQDSFTDGALWGMTVWSYVFDSESTLPTGFVLDPGEMLFAYLLDGDDAMTVSIDSFSIGNPDLMPITSIGYETSIIPPDFDALDFQNPFVFGYSGTAQASIFNFLGDPSDPFSTLEPDEWSLVWYIAESTTWTFGSATASGAGASINNDVPVPGIPAPGSAALLALAGLVTAHRRRR